MVKKRIDTSNVIVLDKVMAGLLLLGNLVFSVGGNYVLTNYRLTEAERAEEKLDTRITQLETYGHPDQDQERRITKLETRADIAGTSIGDLNTSVAKLSTKLDSALSILERMDRQTSNEVQRGKDLSEKDSTGPSW